MSYSSSEIEEEKQGGAGRIALFFCPAGDCSKFVCADIAAGIAEQMLLKIIFYPSWMG